MTSDSKIRANRVNAQRSTGPKTAQGRARAARNAVRHNLSLPVCSIPSLYEEVEALAREISGTHADASLHELARRIAEAQIDLYRVHRVRHLWLCKHLGANDSTCGPLDAQQLLAMDRYERRALSRRKFAIRDFDEARRNSARAA